MQKSLPKPKNYYY